MIGDATRSALQAVEALCRETPSLRPIAEERLARLVGELREWAPAHAAMAAERRAAAVLPSGIMFRDETVATMLREDPSLLALVNEVAAELQEALGAEVRIEMRASLEPEGCRICSPEAPLMYVFLPSGTLELPADYKTWELENWDRLAAVDLLVMPDWAAEEGDGGASAS